MRHDFDKVLTERPRYGGLSGDCRKTYDRKTRPREKRYFKGVEVDARPKRESMRRRHKVNGYSKEFADHLSPLERYLLSQAGRPWDKVWSDVCKVLRGTGLQAAHVKQHVKYMVGGIPHSGESFFESKEWFRPGSSRQPVYVDEHGILRRNPDRR